MGARCTTDCVEIAAPFSPIAHGRALDKARQEQAKRRQEVSRPSNVLGVSDDPVQDEENDEQGEEDSSGIITKIMKRTGRRASVMAQGEMSYQTFGRHIVEEVNKANVAAAVAAGRQLEDVQDEASVRAEKRRIAKRGETALDALFAACLRGDYKKVGKAIENGADINKQDARGKTPLMATASSAGKEAIHICKLLEGKKADIHARDPEGWTPLLHACRSGKTDMVHHLLHAQSNACAVTNDTRTALMLAVNEGKISLVNKLLEEKELRKMIGDKDKAGETTLHHAVRDSPPEVVKLLISNAAKVAGKDIDGLTALHVVCGQGGDDSQVMIRLLLKMKAQVDALDRFKTTPLMTACHAGQEEVAILLHSKKADQHLRDQGGSCPRDIAIANGLSTFIHMCKSKHHDHKHHGEADDEEADHHGEHGES